MNRKQQAKDKDIVSLLGDMGYSPTKKGNTKAWYLSPLASENEASFVVNIKKNTWRDFGRGVGGDTISFIMEHEQCDFPEAISFILDGKIERSKFVPPVVDDKREAIEIIDVRYLRNKYLLQYGKSRCINPNILSMHCREVDFVFTEWDSITHTAIGFQNNKGGWELRSPTKKIGNSPKYWTMVRGTSSEDACDVFEGFFDFLSHLQYHDLIYPERDSIILNSLVFSSWVKPTLDYYSVVALYFDNDEAATRHINEHFTDKKYAICSDMYADYPDYNEFLKSQMQ